MAGGTFLVQNKVRAGAYIRFRSVKQSFAAVGSRGIAALPLKLGFGPVGTLVEVNADTDIRKTFGYDPSDTELLLLRECAKRAQTVLVYRLADGQKASCTAENLTVTARYGGSGGNRMTVRVSGEEAPFLVETFLDGTLVHSQSAGEISQLVSNDWVEFSGSGALQPHAGIVLSGGSDEEVTAQSYDGFFAALQKVTFQTFAIPTDDAEVIRAAVAFAKSMREDEGNPIQAVVAGYPQADYEGVISVKNGVILEDGTTLSAADATAYVAGMTAGAQVNESCTYDLYDGAVDVDEHYSNSQIISALQAGEWIFIPRNGSVVVEQDINSFTSFTADKGKTFSKNRPLRVMDGLAADLRLLFEQYYLGKTGNSADGRSLFKAEVVGYLQQLQDIGAIDGLDPAQDVEVLPGTDSDAVVVNLSICPVDSMEKLYMTVQIQ